MKPHENLDPLVIGGKSYHSRLLIGTGKYKDFAETRAAVEASGAEIVTVAIRRTNIGQDPQMSLPASSLSNAEMNELAAYFSRQIPAAPSHKTAPENVSAGRRLAEQFHCVQCHGPALLGLQHIPRLAGQQFAYLKTQLRGFKVGTRADMDGNMTSAAQSLSDNEIEVLADYLSGLSGR